MASIAASPIGSSTRYHPRNLDLVTGRVDAAIEDWPEPLPPFRFAGATGSRSDRSTRWGDICDFLLEGINPGLSIGSSSKAALDPDMTVGECDLHREGGGTVWDYLVISHGLTMARCAGSCTDFCGRNPVAGKSDPESNIAK